MLLLRHEVNDADRKCYCGHERWLHDSATGECRHADHAGDYQYKRDCACGFFERPSASGFYRD